MQFNITNNYNFKKTRAEPDYRINIFALMTEFKKLLQAVCHLQLER